MKAIRAMLQGLTFEDLREWAGAKILNRGKSYVKKVEQLSRTADGGLAAWVSGSETYATSAWRDADGGLESFCTCPYDRGTCKHAVVLVLVAAEQVKRQQEIPLLDPEDDLFLTLCGDSEDDDEWEEAVDEREEAAAPAQRKEKDGARVETILAGKSKEELIALLVDLAGRHPEVERRIRESEQMASGRVDKLVRSLRSEIRNITAEPAWYNSWKGEGNIPDYSHVREQLQALLDNGHADAVLKLGDELWTRGRDQVEQSHDEGETATAIADCLAVVLQALPQTSLTPPEQLLWVIDRQLEDEYSLLDSGEEVLLSRAYTQAHWREVAETLEARLDAMARPRSASFSDTYRRERVMNRLLDAYRRSGRPEKVIPLLEKEADACRSYGALVDALLAAGERDKARQWCIQGFNRTIAEAPGTAGGLQERLRKMAEAEKRFGLAAAYRAEDFFERPFRQTYVELRKTAEEIKAWPAVRACALKYLETGQRPEGNSVGEKGKASWPLPAPEVKRPRNKGERRYERFPNREMLIDVAILEERFDDVVELYQEFKKTTRWGGETGKAVAQAVAKTHPQVALDIWGAIVDDLIGQVKPKAYEEAAGYLRIMREVSEETARMADWEGLIVRLRVEHKVRDGYWKCLMGWRRGRLSAEGRGRPGRLVKRGRSRSDRRSAFGLTGRGIGRRRATWNRISPQSSGLCRPTPSAARPWRR